MKLLILFFIANASIVSAQERISVAFDDLPKLIRERNNHFKGGQQFLRAAESQTGHLTRSFLPRLSGDIGQESFKRGGLSEISQPYGAVEAKVNLYRGGKDALEEDIREKNVELSKVETENIFIAELSKARRTFWGLIFQKELLRILKVAQEHNEKNLSAANKRIRAGVASETDRLDFEMERTKLDQDIARLSLGIKNSARELRVLLGIEETIQIETIDLIPHQHDDALFKVRLDSESQREVRTLSTNRQVAEARKTQSYRWWMPSVDAYGAYGLHTFREIENLDQQNRYESVLGLRLSLEIFDGLQSASNGARYSLEAEGFRMQAQQASKELKARFDSAQEELKLTHDLVHSAEQAVELGQRYLQRTLAEYTRGAKNSPDVLGANQRFTDYQRRAIELKKDYQMARTDLMAILGQ